MKNIAFILVTVFFGFGINAQSLQSFGLKGNVKSIAEELKICSNRYGKAQTKDCSSLTSEKQFTKEGYLLENKNSLEFEGITREKAEIPTGWLETVYIEEDGVNRKFAENYYDKENLKLKSISFYESDTVFNVTDYFYDEMGRNTKWEKTSKLNGVKEITISFFDEYGTFCGFEMYHDDVLYEKGKFDITYEFDEKGNWVHFTVINEFSTDIHNRTITYY